METKTKRQKNWTAACDEELMRRHNDELLSDIARDMGYAYPTVARHAHKLGLYKPARGGYKTTAREIIAQSFHDHSYRELAKLAKVNIRTVWFIINELGLERTEEQTKAILSRIHKETYEAERRRVNWGLEQKTNLVIYPSKRKRLLRCRMGKKGYIIDDDGYTLYYTEDTRRSLVCEEHGRAMGLSIGPLPTDDVEETEENPASQGMWDDEVRPEQLSLA